MLFFVKARVGRRTAGGRSYARRGLVAEALNTGEHEVPSLVTIADIVPVPEPRPFTAILAADGESRPN